MIFELVLVGSGAVLRDNLLVKLAKLLKYLKVQVIVDEILTDVRIPKTINFVDIFWTYGCVIGVTEYPLLGVTA